MLPGAVAAPAGPDGRSQGVEPQSAFAPPEDPNVPAFAAAPADAITGLAVGLTGC